MASSSEVKFVIEEVTALKDKITNVEKHLNQLNHSQRKSNSKNKQERKRTKKCILTQKGNVYKIAEKLKEIESRNSKLSEWATTSGMSSKVGQGWDGRPESKMSIFYGLGTNWCVCPRQIWKYLGDESDNELITRRKCISLIMGLVLALLLLAIVIGLIIGLATSIQDPTESPIKFVVIPGDADGTNPTDGTDP